jgi:hypothetical protein
VKINENEADKAAPLLKTLLEGVEMTEKQMSEVYSAISFFSSLIDFDSALCTDLYQ